MSNGMSILGERHTIEIILMVYDNPGIKTTEIVRSSASGERTRSVRIRELIDAGILRATSGEHWRGQYFELTETGRRIAEHLDEIRKNFEEDAAGE